MVTNGYGGYGGYRELLELTIILFLGGIPRRGVNSFDPRANVTHAFRMWLC